MKTISRKFYSCPHCGHSIEVTLDTSQGSQEFYDDCPACCQTIHLTMQLDELHDEIQLSVDADDEQYF